VITEGGIATRDPLPLVSLGLSAMGLLVNCFYAIGWVRFDRCFVFLQKQWYGDTNYEAIYQHGLITDGNGRPCKHPFAEVKARLQSGAVNEFGYLVWSPPSLLVKDAQFGENDISSDRQTFNSIILSCYGYPPLSCTHSLLTCAPLRDQLCACIYVGVSGIVIC
jgi:hypothetical protein